MKACSTENLIGKQEIFDNVSNKHKLIIKRVINSLLHMEHYRVIKVIFAAFFEPGFLGFLL